jgi:hypothetical protein
VNRLYLGGVAALAALLIAFSGSAIAAKGSGQKSGGGATSGNTLGLAMVDDLNGNGLPNFGDTVTFNVSTSASYPSVQLACYQNGALVFEQSAGFFPTYVWSKDFTLKADKWTGGAADCTAVLYHTAKNGSTSTLATLSFHADA